MRDVPATFQGSTVDDDGEPWLGYIRVSTWREEKISPEIQRDAILELAKRTNRRIVGWVEDLDVSGRHFRRKIMKCIERVEAGEVRGVAVWKYSRFGRDRTGNAANLARLQQAGGELESATEPVDATTAIGRFQRGMILEFSAFESDRAGEQWRETHDHRKYKLGLPAQGRKRFGYIWHKRWDEAAGTLQKEWYEPETVSAGPAIADRYREYVAGDGFGILAIRLNTDGHRTTQGTLWTTDTLARYMDSGFAAGLLRVHDPECRCGKKNGTCRIRIYIQGAQEELIDYGLWEAYRKRRAEVAATYPRSRVGIYELTGLPKCGGCRKGTSLNARRGHNGSHETGFAYRCSLRAKAGPLACDGVLVPRNLVEAEVYRWLKREGAAGIDGSPATDLRRAPRDDRAAHARARVRAQADVDKQSAALARLRADYAADPDDYGPGEYEAAAGLIRSKRAAAQSALDNLPAEVEPLPDRAEFEPLISSTLTEWPVLITPERNALLRKLLRRVVLIRHGSASADVEIVMHPRWEPDPWAVIPGQVVRNELPAGSDIPRGMTPESPDTHQAEVPGAEHNARHPAVDFTHPDARLDRTQELAGHDLDRRGGAAPAHLW
ncbi:recombinase family protein [Streptomyces sp. NBC_01237]|uniref:recombinase family protein n=1 Tax=Streptomyces sp. NBC_01237 TaxID=2903790 RepID=UPI002DDB8EFD|nr:recombinase family protein [Streptomyces sp. NBC_01237]WRZ73817.1 recombinase family protein [Streptomyces sp. NBC_01237]